MEKISGSENKFKKLLIIDALSFSNSFERGN
jgi:hypothetical protein